MRCKVTRPDSCIKHSRRAFHEVKSTSTVQAPNAAPAASPGIAYELVQGKLVRCLYAGEE